MHVICNLSMRHVRISCAFHGAEAELCNGRTARMSQNNSAKSGSPETTLMSAEVIPKTNLAFSSLSRCDIDFAIIFIVRITRAAHPVREFIPFMAIQMPIRICC